MASDDTDGLARRKGVAGGFHGLIQGFGDRIQGKVIIRDSIGSSKAYDDFGVRLARFGDRSDRQAARQSRDSRIPDLAPRDTSAIDHLMQQHFAQESQTRGVEVNGHAEGHGKPMETEKAKTGSSAYPLYLRALLSELPLTPFETFAHPVTCIIAVSSRNPDPTETLRLLYAQSSRGFPPWISVEFLRYYVLVHDEDEDDITKTTALFESMKRHFGLHCHLLRLQSAQCVATDDDTLPLPKSIWLPAQDLVKEENLIDDGSDDPEIHIFESDASAIRTFLREMVTQSIVPFMETRMMTWNDQVASKRKGISGRFMSLSKRWTGFGSMKGSKTDSTSSSSNYDASPGAYPPDSPEHTMRQLADYAFMLRDFKLAYGTFDIIRSDFAHDKAWAHHAAANEMSAATYLLLPQNAKFRFDAVNALLDSAVYSYLTRCEMPGGALRALIMNMELLKIKRTDDAPRWGGRLLELGVLSPIEQTLIAERMAECYQLQTLVTDREMGNRVRQAAFWSVLAAQSWIQIRQPEQAKRHMDESLRLLGNFYDLPDNAVPFDNMIPFRSAIQEGFVEITEPLENGFSGVSLDDVEEPLTDAKEKLVVQPSSSQRRSISGGGAQISGNHSRNKMQPPGILADQTEVMDDGFE